jgi:hypothetical protein
MSNIRFKTVYLFHLRLSYFLVASLLINGRMPTNDLLESHSGAKEALMQLQLSKEKVNNNKQKTQENIQPKRKNSDTHNKCNIDCWNRPTTSKGFDQEKNGNSSACTASHVPIKHSKNKRARQVEDKNEIEEDDDDVLDYEPFIVKAIGSDKATYTLEIFIRDVITCLSRRDVARKTDPRAPVIYDRKNQAHAIIPSNHKLLLYAKRTATKKNQTLKSKKFVLFKFYVDGTALSEGELYETSLTNPDVHWAKTHIKTTQTVEDVQTVENTTDANPLLGKFKIEIWTRLRETNVIEEFKAMPEDDRSHEKRKQRICIADSEEGGVEARMFDRPVGGLVGHGPPQVVLNVCYDDLLGTRSRHLFEKEFSMNRLKLAGVTDAMFKEAYPNPIKKQEGVIDISDDSNDMDEAVIANMIDEDSEIKEKLEIEETILGASTEQMYPQQHNKDEKFENKDLMPIKDAEEGPLMRRLTSNMDKVVNENTTQLDQTNEDKYSIELRTVCGNITRIFVKQSYSVAEITGHFLKYRAANPSCDNICCTHSANSHLKLSFDGDTLRQDSTIKELGIECGDMIDVYVLDKR